MSALLCPLQSVLCFQIYCKPGKNNAVLLRGINWTTVCASVLLVQLSWLRNTKLLSFLKVKCLGCSKCKAFHLHLSLVPGDMVVIEQLVYNNLCQYTIYNNLCQYTIYNNLCQYNIYNKLCQYNIYNNLCQYNIYNNLCQYNIHDNLCQYNIGFAILTCRKCFFKSVSSEIMLFGV